MVFDRRCWESPSSNCDARKYVLREVYGYATVATNRITAGLKAHAIPLGPATAAVRGGRTVSSAVSRQFDTATLVGLGEATHGTRECFQQKRRLVRHLVCEHGFRTVAFEADTAAATAMDTFVRGSFRDGDADAAAALDTLEMWQWQTKSVATLLRWLRAFNTGRAGVDQVRIRGVDLSTPAAPATALRRLAERIGPDTVPTKALATVEATTVPDNDTDRKQVLDAAIEAAATLEAWVAGQDSSNTAPEPAVADAQYQSRAITQACEWARVRHEQPGPHPAGMAMRDQFLAENSLWALAHDTGDGVALWAHNGHIQRGTFDDGSAWSDVQTMGSRLAAELGDRYRPVGFDFARGSFRAVGAKSSTVETFAVGDPIATSATATFAAVGDGPYALDLAAAAEDDRLDTWLTSERHTRYIGSVFNPEADPEAAYARTNLPASFDCLLFLPMSTPSRPVE